MRISKVQAQVARETAIILPGEVNGVIRLLGRCPVDVWNKGEVWYPSLHQWAQQQAAQTGYSVREVADVLAIYSVHNGWANNKPMAERALTNHTYRRGLVNSKTGFDAGLLVRMVLDHGKTLAQSLDRLHLGDSYYKIRMFTRNIQLLDGVTIDRYMYALFNKPQNNDWYVWCARRIAYVAQLFALLPRDAQAIAWMAAAYDRGENLNNYVAVRV